MSEGDNQSHIMLALGRGNTRLFRNHCGAGWTGKLARTEGPYTIIMNARRCTFGIANPGGSDLIGWHTVTITPDMVGKRVAVFTGIEVKRDDGGVTSDDQTKFGAAVQRSGGLWGVARNPDEARLIVEASL